MSSRGWLGVDLDGTLAFYDGWKGIDDGNKTHGLCFLPVGGLVEGDCMLAQKNALELFEEEALKVANVIGGPVDMRAGAVSWVDEARDVWVARHFVVDPWRSV